MLEIGCTEDRRPIHFGPGPLTSGLADPLRAWPLNFRSLADPFPAQSGATFDFLREVFTALPLALSRRLAALFQLVGSGAKPLCGRLPRCPA